MIETLLGTLFGGLFRLAPELMKWLDRKDERKHELNMFDKQLAAEKLKVEAAAVSAAAAQQLAETQGSTQIGLAEVQALIAGTQAQAQQTGIKWVDAMNSLVRPILAFQWLILLWPGVIIASLVSAVQSGVDPVHALEAIFSHDEKAMAASIASFWLVDRSLRHNGK